MKSEFMTMRDDNKSATAEIELKTINSEQAKEKEEEGQSSIEKDLTINNEEQFALLEVSQQPEQIRSK